MTVQFLSETAPTACFDIHNCFGIKPFPVKLLASPNLTLLLPDAPLLSIDNNLRSDCYQRSDPYKHRVLDYCQPKLAYRVINNIST